MAITNLFVEMLLNALKTGFLLLLLTGIFLVAGLILGGVQGLLIALFLSLAMNILAFWKSDKLALAMTRAKPVTEEEDRELHSLVEHQAMLAQIPKPKVYVIENDSLNAFATGRSPKHGTMAVTRGIRTALSRDELSAVIAHELAHIGNRDTLIMTMAAAIAGAIAMLAWWAQWSLLLGGLGGRGRGGGGGNALSLVVLLAIMIVVPIAATMVRLAISRSREYQADATGAKTSGTPWALANALSKLEQGATTRPMKVNDGVTHLFIVHPFKGGFSGLFATHPPVKERIRRLSDMQENW